MSKQPDQSIAWPARVRVGSPRQAALTFRVGAIRYTAEIAPDPIELEARECCGLIIREQARVYLRGDMDPQQRISVFLHEVRHAWQFEVPRPRTAEEEDVEALARKLEAQGRRRKRAAAAKIGGAA